GLLQNSDATNARLAVVAPKRPLGFFAGGTPDDFFDLRVCTPSGYLLGENVYFDKEKLWDKRLAARPDEVLSTSLHRGLYSKLFKGGVFDPVGWAKNTFYEQIGFRSETVAGDKTGADVMLGNRGPQGNVTIQFSSAPTQIDILGMTLTDFSTSQS